MKITDMQRDIIYLLKENISMTASDLAKELGVEAEEIKKSISILNNLDLIGERESSSYYYNGVRAFSKLRELLKMLPVESVMSMPVIIEDKSSIYDAIVMLFLENVGAIYVTRDKFLVGVLSRKDLLRATLGHMNLHETPVNIIMTRMPNIKFVKKDDSIMECAKLIVDSQVDGLPVLEKSEDKGYKVLGRVTKTNITNLFVNLGNDYGGEGLI